MFVILAWVAPLHWPFLLARFRYLRLSSDWVDVYGRLKLAYDWINPRWLLLWWEAGLIGPIMLQELKLPLNVPLIAHEEETNAL